MDTDSTQGLAIIKSSGTTVLYDIFKYMQILAQVFIVIGILSLLAGSKRMRYSLEHLLFAIISLTILVAGITVPFFASSLQTTRLYQISLIFLAPFFVVGWESVFALLGRAGAKINLRDKGLSLKFLSIFIVIYLSFNTGLIFERFGDVTPMSLSLNARQDLPRFNHLEVAGSRWLANTAFANAGPEGSLNFTQYGDGYRCLLLQGILYGTAGMFPDDPSSIPGDAYIFLGTLNLDSGKVLVFDRVDGMNKKVYVDSDELLDGRSRVYTNGGAEIFT